MRNASAAAHFPILLKVLSTFTSLHSPLSLTSFDTNDTRYLLWKPLCIWRMNRMKVILFVRRSCLYSGLHVVWTNEQTHWACHVSASPWMPRGIDVRVHMIHISCHVELRSESECILAIARDRCLIPNYSPRPRSIIQLNDPIQWRSSRPSNRWPMPMPFL